MAEFCFQCSLELFFGPPGDFKGLVDEEHGLLGYNALVLCEGCGITKVDHRGWCISPYCDLGHGEVSPERLEVLRSEWATWERRSGPLGWAYRLHDRFFGSRWELGEIHFEGTWLNRLSCFWESLWTGEPLHYPPVDYVYNEFLWEFTDYAAAPHQSADGKEPASTGTGPTGEDDQRPASPGVVRD